MKVFIIVALCVVAACAIPLDEQKQDAEVPLSVVDLEAEAPPAVDSELLRQKRQWGGYGGYGGGFGGYGGGGYGRGYGGYGGGYGRGYGGYGGYGGRGYGGYGGYGWGK